MLFAIMNFHCVRYTQHSSVERDGTRHEETRNFSQEIQSLAATVCALTFFSFETEKCAMKIASELSRAAVAPIKSCNE